MGQAPPAEDHQEKIRNTRALERLEKKGGNRRGEIDQIITSQSVIFRRFLRTRSLSHAS